MLCVNSATFALYMVSIVLYYVFFTFYYYTDDHSTNKALVMFLISGIFSACCNFLSQACLCVIFWQFASTKPEAK